jgi:photosystem II stability/assembly factor-like uncharacterized protein
MVLYDDGAHADGQADDGVYSNYYSRTGRIGSYQFKLSASGNSSDGGIFSRLYYLSTVSVLAGDGDGDGMPDNWERGVGLDPTVNDAAADPDGDGLNNLREYQNGTDPYTADSDLDELGDGPEVDAHRTNPTNADSDLGGETDGSEVAAGRDPLDPSDDFDRSQTTYLPMVCREHGVAPSPWRAGTGIQSRSVHALAVDPGNCNTVYAATDQGLYKSTDGGNLWAPTSLNALLAVQPLAASDAPTFAKADESATGPTLISAVTTDPHNGQIVYAAAWGQGIFKSTNGGQSWAQVNNGLGCLWLYDIDAVPNNGQVLYAGGVEYPAGQGGGVWKSTNGGASWSQVSNGLGSRNVHALALDPSSPSVIYAGTRAGIFKSYNSAGYWQGIGQPGSGHPWAIVVDPRNGQNVYVALGGGGVYLSTSGGGGWSPANTGLTNRDLRALTIDPGNSQRLYAGSDGGGVYVTGNAGGSWDAMNRGLASLDVKALCQQTGCGIIHAGTADGAWWYRP